MARLLVQYFLRFSREEQENVPDDELPVIPTKELRNGLVLSCAVRQNGVLGWLIKQQGSSGIKTVWAPMYFDKPMPQKGKGVVYKYKLNPYEGIYDFDYHAMGLPTIEDIGVYGRKWMTFMRTNYYDYVDYLCFMGQWMTRALEVDTRANELAKQLDEQYEEQHPRPKKGSVEKNAKWERARKSYVDEEVMREVVLIAPPPPFSDPAESDFTTESDFTFEIPDDISF